MGGGRKNLKRAAIAGKKENLTVEDGHSIVQVVSLLGSNSIEKSPDWPEVFRSKTKDGPNASSKQGVNELNQSDDDEDYDGLPPLKANMNRVQTFQSQPGENEDSDTDSS